MTNITVIGQVSLSLWAPETISSPVSLACHKDSLGALDCFFGGGLYSTFPAQAGCWLQGFKNGFECLWVKTIHKSGHKLACFQSQNTLTTFFLIILYFPDSFSHVVTCWPDVCHNWLTPRLVGFKHISIVSNESSCLSIA